MVLYNNFTYNFGSTNKKDNSTRGECVTRTRDTKLYTNKNDAFTTAVGEHNHNEYDKSNTNRQIINTVCKRKSLEDLHTRPKKLILK
jgi:hypothetical protein